MATELNWIQIESISTPQKGSKRKKFPITGVIKMEQKKFLLDYIPFTLFEWYCASEVTDDQCENIKELLKNKKIEYDLFFNVKENKFYSIDETPDHVKLNFKNFKD